VSIASTDGLLRYRLALVGAGVLWSMGGLLIKLLTVNPAWQSSALGITFHRSLFASLCLLPLALLRRPREADAPFWPRPLDAAAAILFYVLLLGLYVAATQGTSAANAIFLQYTAPLYAAALSPLLLGERFLGADGVAIAAAMGGIAILFFGGFRGGEQGPLLMGLGSGLMFGLFLVWLRRMRHADPVAITASNNLGVALLAGLALAVVRPAEVMLAPRALFGDPALLPVVGLLALMGVAQIALPYVLFSYGLQRVSSVEASLLALVEPVLNPVWVGLFYGERPALTTVIGGAVIVLALALRYTLFRTPPAQER
jgi:drug/metabolite transporter (DMT)-like permease